MRKLTAKLAASFFIVALAVVALSAVFVPARVAAGPNDACFIVGDNGVVIKYPDCSYGTLEALGFNLSGVPNPVVGCWEWKVGSAEAKSEKVDCAVRHPNAIDADKANCYSPDSNGGYRKYVCDEATASLVGKTLEPGKCYVTQGDTGSLSVSGREIDCPLVIGAKAQAQEAKTDAEAGACDGEICTGDIQGNDQWRCGDEGRGGFKPTFNIGCTGKGNPIVDLSFAGVRIVTAGIGIVMVISIIVGGIQYTLSAGDPNATANAKKRLQSTAVAFLFYLFTYAILNWLIPTGII